MKGRRRRLGKEMCTHNDDTTRRLLITLIYPQLPDPHSNFRWSVEKDEHRNEEKRQGMKLVSVTMTKIRIVTTSRYDNRTRENLEIFISPTREIISLPVCCGSYWSTMNSDVLFSIAAELVSWRSTKKNVVLKKMCTVLIVDDLRAGRDGITAGAATINQPFIVELLASTWPLHIVACVASYRWLAKLRCTYPRMHLPCKKHFHLEFSLGGARSSRASRSVYSGSVHVMQHASWSCS